VNGPFFWTMADPPETVRRHGYLYDSLGRPLMQLRWVWTMPRLKMLALVARCEREEA
jgi:hypothetical protein